MNKGVLNIKKKINNFYAYEINIFLPHQKNAKEMF